MKPGWCVVFADGEATNEALPASSPSPTGRGAGVRGGHGESPSPTGRGVGVRGRSTCQLHEPTAPHPALRATPAFAGAGSSPDGRRTKPLSHRERGWGEGPQHLPTPRRDGPSSGAPRHPRLRGGCSFSRREKEQPGAACRLLPTVHLLSSVICRPSSVRHATALRLHRRIRKAVIPGCPQPAATRDRPAAFFARLPAAAALSASRRAFPAAPGRDLARAAACTHHANRRAHRPARRRHHRAGT